MRAKRDGYIRVDDWVNCQCTPAGSDEYIFSLFIPVTSYGAGITIERDNKGNRKMQMGMTSSILTCSVQQCNYILHKHYGLRKLFTSRLHETEASRAQSRDPQSSIGQRLNCFREQRLEWKKLWSRVSLNKLFFYSCLLNRIMILLCLFYFIFFCRDKVIAMMQQDWWSVPAAAADDLLPVIPLSFSVSADSRWFVADR